MLAKRNILQYDMSHYRVVLCFRIISLTFTPLENGKICFCFLL